MGTVRKKNTDRWGQSGGATLIDGDSQEEQHNRWEQSEGGT